MYKYRKRSSIAYEDTKHYFINNDISCMKYHYNVDPTLQNMDMNYAILKLSPDGKRLIINNLKLYGFNRVNDEKIENSEKKA